MGGARGVVQKINSNGTVDVKWMHLSSPEATSCHVSKRALMKVARLASSGVSAMEAPVARSSESNMPLANLLNSDIVKALGVDASRKEDYLSDDDFVLALGMNKEEFSQIPQWKRDSLKKRAGLF